MFRFELLHSDGAARRGRMLTAHGSVETPVFMAVGTQATVKGLTPDQLESVGVQVVLGNTYHLVLRPGDELIAEMGGLHRFMNWHRPILTDSGGFQIFSLGKNRRPDAAPPVAEAPIAFKITDEGAVFRSHLDGTLLELTPEKAVRIQENLGSDIAMCLDECPAADAGLTYHKEAVRRTIQWAKRCQATQRRSDQALFAIVQGGINPELRAECATPWSPWIFPVMRWAASAWAKPPSR